MNPSDVRARVLAEHLWLSEKLNRVEDSAASVIAGKAAEAARLRERTTNLCDALSFHLATEDEILVPLLRNLDAWGEVRVERVRSDHQTQRAELTELRWEAQTLAPEELAELVLTFAKALRADMANEEQVSLNRDLLRDDPMSVDQLDG